MTKVFFVYIQLKRGRVYGVLALYDGYTIATRICSRRGWLKNDLLFSNQEAQVLLALNGITLDDAKRDNKEVEARSVTHLIEILQDLRSDYEKSGVGKTSRVAQGPEKIPKTTRKDPK